jgi:hypothetical protein
MKKTKWGDGVEWRGGLLFGVVMSDLIVNRISLESKCGARHGGSHL